MPAYAELYIDQGTTFNNEINITDDITNAVINISGYSVSSQIRRSFFSANATANIICTITNAANGDISLTIPAGNTSNIPAGRYLYDVKMTDTSNVTTRILEGIITINPAVTR